MGPRVAAALRGLAAAAAELADAVEAEEQGDAARVPEAPKSRPKRRRPRLAVVRPAGESTEMDAARAARVLAKNGLRSR